MSKHALATNFRRFNTGERYRETVLRNGFNVASLSIPGAKTVAVGVWVPYGSKHERKGTLGWAHLLEHMVFRRTEKHTASQVSELIDQYPVAEAHSGVDSTFFYLVSRPEDLRDMVALLYELFAKPAFDEIDLKVERKAVIAEIAGREDNLDDIVEMQAHKAVYAGSSCANWPWGTREAINAATAAKLHVTRQKNYTTAGSYLVAAGSLRHQTLLNTALKSFGRSKKTYRRASGERGKANPRTGLRTITRTSVRQPALVYRYLIPPASHPDYAALLLFAEHFGRQESGALYQEIRVKRGAAYETHAETTSYARYGEFNISLRVKSAKFAQTHTLLHKIIAQAKDQPMTQERFETVRDRLEAKIRHQLSTPEAMLEDWFENLACEGRLISFSERINGLRSLVLADVHRVVREYLNDPVIIAAGPESALLEVKRAERQHLKKERQLLKEAQLLEEEEEAYASEADQ